MIIMLMPVMQIRPVGMGMGRPFVAVAVFMVGDIPFMLMIVVEIVVPMEMGMLHRTVPVQVFVPLQGQQGYGSEEEYHGNPLHATYRFR